MNIPTEGYASRILEAINGGNIHLDLLLDDYFSKVIGGLSSYRIDYHSFNSVESLLDTIEACTKDIDSLKEDFVYVLSKVIKSKKACTPDLMCEFFRNLLKYYSNLGINLYTSKDTQAISFDPFRYFNQAVFISFAALSLNCRRFDLLASVTEDRYTVNNQFGRNSGELLNFIRFREYNYTLNEYRNNGNPRRISATADYIISHSKQIPGNDMISADLVVYYLSLIHSGDSFLEKYWFPELSCYNENNEILPELRYAGFFAQAKVLFGVNSVEEYRMLLDSIDNQMNQNSMFRVPPIKTALLYDTVGSIK